MMTTITNIVDALQQLAPLNLAAAWDNVGLLLGDSKTPAPRVMTCLTVTPDVVAEAIASQASLIVSHHPILFRAIKRLTTATPEGRMLLDLVRAGIGVYSAHTAYDNCVGGINDQLCESLGLSNVTPLRRQDATRKCKVVVFVPDKDLGRVGDAMFAAGAGQIGQYRECSFRLAGTGAFFGTEVTNPTLGEKGRREEVTEWRLEVVCAEVDVERVLSAMRSAHSYEEPAYDVYSLRPERANVGEGRIGDLASPMKLGAFSGRVKSALAASTVQMVGSADRMVKRVALACGAAGEFLADARIARADVFMTGEARFHDSLAAETERIAMVLPGHYATERFAMESLARWLAERFPGVKVWASEREHDPLVACG